MGPEFDFDTSIDGNECAFHYPDIPLDGLGRFQVHRVRHVAGCNGRFQSQSDDRLPRTRRLRDFGAKACKSSGLEGMAKEERPRFGARLSIEVGGGWSWSRRQQVTGQGRSIVCLRNCQVLFSTKPASDDDDDCSDRRHRVLQRLQAYGSSGLRCLGLQGISFALNQHIR